MRHNKDNKKKKKSYYLCNHKIINTSTMPLQS